MYIWEYWQRMSALRTRTEKGLPNPVVHSEMIAWAHLTGTRLAPYEVEAITGIEQRYLARCVKILSAAAKK